jgi:hypothetical protein
VTVAESAIALGAAIDTRRVATNRAATKLIRDSFIFFTSERALNIGSAS